MRWHPDFVDIISPGGGKDQGMDAILDFFGISLEDTMAFGDGENDIPMLRHAHVGVAMGNAYALTPTLCPGQWMRTVFCPLWNISVCCSPRLLHIIYNFLWIFFPGPCTIKTRIGTEGGTVT